MNLHDTACQEVQALAGLDREGQRAEWYRRWGVKPTIRSLDLLRRNLAWRIQAAAFGGIEPQMRKLLAAKGAAASGPPLRPGMRLVREWQGVRHEVEIVEDGVVHAGQQFDSLSSVARFITGVRWNGPRFFGLRREGPQA